MTEVIVQLLGGIGLFLLGMSLMTDTLKNLAGDALRQWFAKFTGSPFKAMSTGIIATLIVQSSMATTLATIGFVSAGILSFAQSIGIIIGANIGTTSTGWMVAFLGVKFSISQYALPFIAFGALAKLLFKGRIALIGLAVAGFGLIFYGIDLLQIAMSGVAERIDLSVFETKDFGGKILLVLFGIVMTIILQSSSAAITTTLAALASQAIQLEQAFMLVIGQNIGTVATAILAAIGANVSAKRTAAVHLSFNVLSAVLAFFILAPMFVHFSAAGQIFAGLSAVVLVAAFHTLFSLLGACIYMPLIPQFSGLLMKLIPDDQDDVMLMLNEASLEVPILALPAIDQVMRHLFTQQFLYLAHAIKDGVYPSAAMLKQLDERLMALEAFIQKLEPFEDQKNQQHVLYILRLMVYLKVLRSDLTQLELTQAIRTQPSLNQLALEYAEVLENELDFNQALQQTKNYQHLLSDLKRLKIAMKANREELRQDIHQYAQLHHLKMNETFELLAGQRWLDRVIAHSQRTVNVLQDQYLFNTTLTEDEHA